MQNILWFDTHCHLDRVPVSDLSPIMEKAKAAGVDGFVVPGVNGFPAKINDLLKYDEVRLCWGIHPMNAGISPCSFPRDKDLSLISAIGECGLDKRLQIPAEVQQKLFIEQLELAAGLELPVIIHLVGCFQAAYDILSRMAKKPVCIFHSWSGSPEMAKRFLDFDAYISLSGSCLKNPDKLKALLSALPPDRLLFETDSPDQLPSGFEADFNEPALLPQIMSRAAQFIGADIAKTAEIVYKNSIRIFEKRRQ